MTPGGKGCVLDRHGGGRCRPPSPKASGGHPASPRAQSCEAHSAKQDGGARRDRTDDLMLAKHALYQLSYGPSFARARPELRRAGPPLSEAFFPCGVAGVGRASSSKAPRARRTMVGPGRLELPTSRLSGVRSNQLSYGPSGSALKPAQTIDLGLAIAPRGPQTLRARRRSRGKRNEDGGDLHLFSVFYDDQIDLKKKSGWSSLERR